MTTMKLGIAGIALTISTAVLANNNVLAGRVPTTYVSIDGLDHIASGSGVAIGPHDVLTAEHVVDDCTAISVDDRDAYVLAHDEVNDLAVVRTKDQWATWALFSNDPSRAGDTVVAVGFPLAGVLADTANVTVGNVSALAGIKGDTRYLQITAPIQPGNSGGAVFDANGGIIGIVHGVLDNKSIGDGDVQQQNVNFAIKAGIARSFLDGSNVKYQVSPNLGKRMSAPDIGAMARPFTVRIECYGKADQVARPDQPKTVQPKTVTQPPQRPLPIPQQPSQAPPLSGGTLQQNFYRVTQNLMLRGAPSKYSDNLLAGYPQDYIPEGTAFANAPYRCTYGSSMYGQTDEVWCRVGYHHDGIETDGWVSAHFLREINGRLLACRYATSDPECIDERNRR
jgi:hypothetical protein